jgi:glycosyltransferase involved in cell wall biosynthesis
VKLLLNGRFFARPVTGVERLAIELTRAARVLLRARGAPDVEVALPPGVADEAKLASLGDPRPAVHVVGRRGGHPWEQADLPGVRPDAWLLSLCNVGPVARRRQAVVICDAQFVLHPESYSRAFRWWYRVLLTVLARRAAVVFTISNFSRDQLERYGIVPRGKAHVLRLGIDHLDRVEADGDAPARHGVVPGGYILAIGSLARHKNLATLVDAFVAAELPDVTLVVAGGGNPRVFQGAGLRQAPNIRYTGRISDAELKGLYAGALAFACPSLSEGFGFTPLEAMTAGCPVIATTGGAVPEVCGDAALYADPLDRDAWRDALRRIVADQPLRADLSARARERAGLFRWEDTARHLLDVLDRADG